MPSFILRQLDPEFWARVQAKAQAEGVTVKALILKLLTQWLAVPVIVLMVILTSACSSPLAPAPIIDAPVTALPASLTLTGGTATTLHEALVNLTVSDATGKGVGGETVFLSTTAGTLNHQTVVTAPNGTAQVMVTTTENANVTGRVRSLVTVTLVAAYQAPPVFEPPVFIPPPPPPIVVTPPAPTPAPQLTAQLTCTSTVHGSPTPCNVTVSYGGTVQPATAITRVDWDWGDGSATTTLSPTAPIATHTYLNAGTYTVFAQVTATTPDGVRMATATKVLVIP